MGLPLSTVPRCHSTTRSIDVAALERLHDPQFEGNDLSWVAGGVPPPAATTFRFVITPDEIEIPIHGNTYDGVRLVGAIELVSPANNDRTEHRRVFVAKCQSYLQKGIGLLIVDVVTDRGGNLHDELMTALGGPAARLGGHLYATAYRPTGKDGVGQLAVWTERLAVGQQLPTMPFRLYGGL